MPATPTPVPAKPPKTPLDYLRAILSDVRLVLGLTFTVCAALVGFGWAAYAQTTDIAKDTARDEVAPVGAKLDSHVQAQKLTDAAIADQLDRVMGEVKDARSDVQSTRAEVRGFREDLRRAFPALPPLRDGGP